MKQHLPVPSGRGFATTVFVAVAAVALPALALPAVASGSGPALLQAGEQGQPILLSQGRGYAKAEGSKRVRALQHGLARLGYASGPADGLFGPQTRAAVVAFQEGHALQVDGIAGPETLGDLGRRLEEQASLLAPGRGLGRPGGSKRVRVLQRDLQADGYRTGPVDGVFGPRTEAAVIAFQQDERLTVDGVAGPETRDHLSAAGPDEKFRKQSKVQLPKLPRTASPDESLVPNDQPNVLTRATRRFGDNSVLWWPLALLVVMAGTVRLVRRFLGGLYRPAESGYREKTSVVAPAFREDPEVLASAVRSWLVSGADEVVLLLPLDEPYHFARVEAAFGDNRRVRLLQTDDPDKRTSLEVGISVARHPIVVLTDSDTLWEPALLRNLLMPFADPRVGGVGSRQRVIGVGTSIWRRAADWMLDSRYLEYVPAMAQAGAVACLSGRTVAYRRSILMKVLPDLAQETFLGKACVSGDDGRLTWLVLNEGYMTTYQANAVAWTMMPSTATGFFGQRLRWARDSYRCYLRAIFRGWLLRQPAITRLSVFQALVAPASVGIGFTFAALSVVYGDVVALAAWLGWITSGRGIRAREHVREDRKQALLLPFMTATILLVESVLKGYALLTMNRQAWITRSGERAVAEGQEGETLAEPVSSIMPIAAAPGDSE